MSWQDHSLVQRKCPTNKTPQKGLSVKGITMRSQFLKTQCLSMEKLLFTATTKLSSRKAHLSPWFDSAPQLHSSI